MDAWSGQHDFSWGPGGVLYDSFQTTTYTPGLSQRRSGADRFMHGRVPASGWRIGSTRYMTDGGGNYMAQEKIRYDGFGNQSHRTGENTRPGDFQFAGRWGYQTEFAFGTEPGVGLQYLEQRYYDPVVGRFLTPDPIGFAGGLNLYGYVENDPVNGFWRPTPQSAPDPWRLAATQISHIFSLKHVTAGHIP